MSKKTRPKPCVVCHTARKDNGAHYQIVDHQTGVNRAVFLCEQHAEPIRSLLASVEQAGPALRTGITQLSELESTPALRAALARSRKKPATKQRKQAE